MPRASHAGGKPREGVVWRRGCNVDSVLATAIFAHETRQGIRRKKGERQQRVDVTLHS